MLFIDAAHERSGRGENLVDEDEDGLLRRELYALADHINELAHGEIGRDQVLLLVDSSNIRLLNLLADDLLIAKPSAAEEAVRGVGEALGRGGDPTQEIKRLTGMRSAYFWRIRSASALRFSKGCSSLNLDRIVGG